MGVQLMAKPVSVDRGLRQAKTLAAKGDIAGALRACQGLLAQFPNDRRVLETMEQLRPTAPAAQGGFNAEMAKPILQMLNAGQFREGLAKARDLLQEHSESAFLNNITGILCGKLSQHGKAANHYRKALEINPDFGEAHCNLGQALTELGKAEEALPHLERAMKLMRVPTLARLNMGYALNQLDRPDEALHYLRMAAEDAADPAVAYNNMGNSLKQLGRFGEAAEAYEKAIELRPGFAGAYRNLSSIKTFTEDDPQIAQMANLLTPEMPAEDQANVAFALSKACEDIGDDDTSFELLAQANRLKKSLTGYTHENDARLFAKIKRFFDTVPDPLPATGEEGPRPIFIVGMPRSGTSLVEQILASHSQVFGAGERAALSLAVRPHVDALTPPIGADALRQIRTEYIDGLKALGQPEPAITDKAPLNFRWVGFILSAMPEAKVIHMRRDPVAIGWSLYKRYFPAPALGFSWDLGDIASYLDIYEDLMAFWHQRFPGQVYDLRYEDLTENQDEETRRLIDHCGLDWEDGCLDFHNTTRVVNTASFAQVRKAMYKGSSDAWRKYGDRLEPLLRRAG